MCVKFVKRAALKRLAVIIGIHVVGGAMKDLQFTFLDLVGQKK